VQKGVKEEAERTLACMSRYAHRLGDICEINGEICEIPSITNTPSSMGNSMLKPRETTPLKSKQLKGGKRRNTTDTCV